MNVIKFKKIEVAGSAVELQKFIDKYKKELEKIFSKGFDSLDEEKHEFSELMDALIDEAKNTGIKGSKVYKIFKEDFKLNYKDLDRVLSELETRLVPKDDKQEEIDSILKERQEYIRQVTAAYHAEQEQLAA